jgi:hypothetical protein
VGLSAVRSVPEGLQGQGVGLSAVRSVPEGLQGQGERIK